MKRTQTDLSNKKFLSSNELPEGISLGLSNCIKLGKESGAEVRIGGRVLYDIDKILAYLKERTEVER